MSGEKQRLPNSYRARGREAYLLCRLLRAGFFSPARLGSKAPHGPVPSRADPPCSSQRLIWNPEFCDLARAYRKCTLFYLDAFDVDRNDPDWEVAMLDKSFVTAVIVALLSLFSTLGTQAADV